MQPNHRNIAYQTFAKLFYYPDEALIDLLWNGVISAFFQELDITTEELDHYLDGFDHPQTLLESLQVEYTQLFITFFPTVPAPIFKSFYTEKEIFGNAAKKILEFYERFNFQVAEDMTEPPDHLAIELEFVYRITEMQIDEVEQHNFIRDEILSWTGPFADKIHQAKTSQFYSYIINVLITYLKQDVSQNEMKLAEAAK